MCAPPPFTALGVKHNIMKRKNDLAFTFSKSVLLPLNNGTSLVL